MSSVSARQHFVMMELKIRMRRISIVEVDVNHVLLVCLVWSAMIVSLAFAMQTVCSAKHLAVMMASGTVQRSM